jgi:hypothetical protein
MEAKLIFLSEFVCQHFSFGSMGDKSVTRDVTIKFDVSFLPLYVHVNL